MASWGSKKFGRVRNCRGRAVFALVVRSASLPPSLTMSRRSHFFLLMLVCCGLLSASAAAPVPLRWHAGSNRVDAAIQGVPLPRVLGRVARATGWKILLEPGTDRVVSATFTNLPAREALGRLLGPLSFVLAPQAKGPARLLIYRSSADAATEAVAPSDDEYTLEPGPIPNELIVRLKPGSKITPEELAKKLGAKLVGRLEELNAYRLRFETPESASAARELLKARDDVAAVENNIRLPAPDRGEPIAKSVTEPGLKPRVVGAKDRIIVALIDTKVQPLPAAYEQFILSRSSVVDPSGAADAGPTHGTVMVQNILQGVSVSDDPVAGSRVRVVAVDVYDPAPAGQEPTTTTWNVARGLYAAAAQGATVFNLSLGGTDPSPMLDDIIASLHNQGAIIPAATGNMGGTALTFPAASPGALGVTAVDRSGQPAPYANTGPQAQLAGPGTMYFQYGGQTWVAQGTSSATAWVSGVAAGAMSASGKPASQIEPMLRTELPFRRANP